MAKTCGGETKAIQGRIMKTSGHAGSATKPVVITSIAGLVAAFLASLCCIGPLVFAALGVGIGVTGALAGTAGFLKALLPYRPWLIGMTILLLGFSFYLAYRKPRAGEPSGQTCGLVSGSHPNRALLWIIATLAVVLVLAPYWLAL
ncbi:MAG TPA: mercuric transporter MerT family protein [Nitrospiraceae bacterium]|jgi:mercuric ion transport protein|nr:mercuric transporter MerT family protein [Nitrospiraceae bacterium]